MYTVGKLIEDLQKLDPKYRVVMPPGDAGYDARLGTREVRLGLDFYRNPQYMGPHERSLDGDTGLLE